MHQREPTLDELLNEPIIRQVMIADGHEPDDIRLLMRRGDRDEILETMVVGTVLGDALFEILRRIAQVEVSGREFKGPEAKPFEHEDHQSTED